MITKSQIQLIHIAKAQAGLNDAEYRMVLRSVGGVESSKELGQGDYEKVMTIFEQRGFVDAKNGRGYWQWKCELAERFANERLVQKIQTLAAMPGNKYPLASLCRKFSDGRTEHPSKLAQAEAWKLIEMLKASVERENENADQLEFSNVG